VTPPRRNRVDPFGAIVAAPERGDLMGNRGCLHDDSGTVIRERTSYKGWVAYAISWKGVRRALMTPGAYTELFFRDEATALAAGHRPCFECRRARAVAFREAWVRAHPTSSGKAGEIDLVLHRERTAESRRLYRPGKRLPDGAMVGARDGPAAFLSSGGAFRPWSFSGYGDPVDLGGRDLVMLTVPSILRTLASGYVPEMHASARP
jgi:hypothetical protein